MFNCRFRAKHEDYFPKSSNVFRFKIIKLVSQIYKLKITLIL